VAGRYTLSQQAILRDCARYLAQIQEPEGFFCPPDSKHQEIAIYQIEATWSLLQTYQILGDPGSLHAATAALDFYAELQHPDGTVPHAPLPATYYRNAKDVVFEFTLAPLERDGRLYPGSEMDPDIFPHRMGVTDGGLAIAARSYAFLTGEDRYRATALLALDHYRDIWDPDYLKANSFVSFYGLSFALVGFKAWEDHHPAAVDMVLQISRLLTEMPVWWAYSPSKLAIVGVGLLTVHGPLYADSHIRPALEDLLQAGLEVLPGGYGMATQDGEQWGQYADIRGTMPLMIIMKAFDEVTGTDTFTSRPEYGRMLGWLQRNRRAARVEGRPFYEIQRSDGSWFGSGTPVCLLPVWWSTGRFAAL
jgi:hypothetical protein